MKTARIPIKVTRVCRIDIPPGPERGVVGADPSRELAASVDDLVAVRRAMWRCPKPTFG
jgi:hypothetical protein